MLDSTGCCEKRTMVVSNGGVSTPRSKLYHASRLIILALIGCGLVTVVTFKPHLALVPINRSGGGGGGGGGGLFRGRAISELWATGRPEQAWFTSAGCRPLVTCFTRDHCLPLVNLASFPRSGNTWTRYLLEASTGIFTTSGGPSYKAYRKNVNNSFVVTDDRIWESARHGAELVKLGYLGEGIPWPQGITIVAKTHALPQPWNSTEADIIQHNLAAFPENATRRAVLIIRDPFKSFISLKKYGATHSVLNSKNMTYLYRGEKWHRFVMERSRIWYNMNAQWIESTNETHVLAYERLTRDPIGELTALLHFLEIEPDRRRMECVHSHMEGKVHNHKHGVIPDNETYPLRLRAELWSHIHQLNWLLKDRDYPALPLQHYSFADEFSDLHMRIS